MGWTAAETGARYMDGEMAKQVAEKHIWVKYWWPPAPEGITWDKTAHQQATNGAHKLRGQYTRMQNLLIYYDCVSFAKISRKIYQKKSEDSTRVIQPMGKTLQYSYQYVLVKWGGNWEAMEYK